jgi:hypothetical protein
MDPEGSLPHLKILATCTYPESVDINFMKLFKKQSFNGAD